MPDVMIDSSVWIEYFRNGAGRISDNVDYLIDHDKVALCGIIELEIIQGMRPKERTRIISLFDALHYIETTRIDYKTAGEYLGRLRAKGISIPSTDSLIAVLCFRKNLQLFSTDRHFDAFSDIKRYNLINVRPGNQQL